MSSRSTSTIPTPAGNIARVAVLVVIAIVAATAVWLGTRGDDGNTGADSGPPDSASHTAAHVRGAASSSSRAVHRTARLSNETVINLLTVHPPW